ncbi:MAG: hypothetical protein BWY76_02923 [bacterium ADurb.Bin429]|nr:MAG: hypothetical protein BWY76_02923 [bacterium ADurb.Bin429]
MRISRESDLYPPLQAYLTAQGYTVRGEVVHCDVAASKGDELIVIELKRNLSLELLAQAAQRQKRCASVYVAIPRPPDVAKWKRQRRDVLHLLRRLELGLILVALEHSRKPVEVVFHPLPAERRLRKHARRAVLEEIAARSLDLNAGGSTRRKLVTAYREQAIRIAVILAQTGPMTPRQLREHGTGTKTLSILSRNVYGWFTRIARGLYALTETGHAAQAEYPELVAQITREPTIPA